MIEPTGGVTLTDRHDLRNWLNESWTSRFIFYMIVVLTVSLIVQVVATLYIAAR